LYEDPYVDATDIEVSVEKGEVILTGTVENRVVKRRVEDLVESVSGLKHFENRLRTRKTNQIVNIRNSE
jgi:osmotically-inducible protein OsmY